MALERVLLLLRHGHRSLKDPTADNGLSGRGKRQAKRFRKDFLREFGKDARPWLLSSPKRRCRETLAPLARRLGCAVGERFDLREKEPGESPARFRARVAHGLRGTLRRPRRVVVLSTHGDWAPLALRLLTGARVHLRKGGWARVDLSPPPARLTALVRPER